MEAPSNHWDLALVSSVDTVVVVVAAVENPTVADTGTAEVQLVPKEIKAGADLG